MKVIRSSKCTLKFSTKEKISKIDKVLSEYGRVANIFIEYFWELDSLPSKSKLLKPIVDIPLYEEADPSWLTARLRKVAAREALDMVKSSRNRNKEKAVKPVHRGNRMHVSCTIANLVPAKHEGSFDSWLRITSVGDNIVMDLPIKLHKHFNKWNERGRRLNSYVITRGYVQLSFEIDTGAKREGTKVVGVDTGINALASVSSRKQYGVDIKDSIERVKRCKRGSKGKKRAIRSLKQKIDEVAIDLILEEDPDLLVVERLKNLGHKSKVKRLLTKNVRRSIGIWNWRYWLTRVEQQCEINRISFRTVAPHYTSQTCTNCSHVDRGNRRGTKFKCQKCGHADNADINAALNIRNRFTLGPYGAQYKQ